MYCNRKSIVLASGSPRRRQFLQEMGLTFSVCSSQVDEIPLSGESPDEFVFRMAKEKTVFARKKFPDSWVIGGDTIVCLGTDILGKPSCEKDAIAMLMSLSGIEHTVKTGFCVACDTAGVLTSQVVTTRVLFADFPESIARAYVATGDCLDKAGAYGIQGKGIFLVKSLNGSYSNVVGLPLTELLQILLKYQVIEVTL